jgi:hypothetical protein
MSKRFPMLLLPVFLSGSLVAAPAMAGNDHPWAEVRIGGVADSDLGEYDVHLIAINGSRDIGSTSVYELQPGMQQLRIASKKRGKSGEITSQPYPLQMKPCVRYELVANHATSTDTQRWWVAVKSESKIKSCVKKFGALLETSDNIADANL